MKVIKLLHKPSKTIVLVNKDDYDVLTNELHFIAKWRKQTATYVTYFGAKEKLNPSDHSIVEVDIKGVPRINHGIYSRTFVIYEEVKNKDYVPLTEAMKVII